MDADNHSLSTEHLSLGLNSRGLTFHSLEVKSRQQSSSQATRDVLVGFQDQEAYRERLFFGSTVGRSVCFSPSSHNLLDKVGVTYLLEMELTLLDRGLVGMRIVYQLVKLL